jgi:CHAT domain-containing protein/tetratricopeptide (TPR) repeat protein
MHRTIFIFLFFLFSIPMSGQKWEKLTVKFRDHYDRYAYAEALEYALKALDYSTQNLDSTEFRYMLSYYNVSLACFGLGEMDRAKEYISVAYRLMVPYYYTGADFAEVCELYGRIETALGFHETAAAFLAYARDIKVQVYGKESYQYIRSLYFMADLEMARAGWEQMAAVLEEALELHEQYFAKNLDYARYANYLGLIYLNNGYNQEASENFQRALSAYPESELEKDFTFCNASNNLALVYYYRSDFENAAFHFEQADSVYRALLQGYSENYMMLINNIASLYYSWGKPDLARDAFHRLEEYLVQYPDPRDLNYIQGVENTADYYAEVGELGKAEEYYKKAIELRRAATPSDPEELAGAMLLLAAVYIDGKRPDLAAEAAVEPFSILLRERPPGDPDLVNISAYLGESFYDLDRKQTSLYYYRLAREQIEQADDPPADQQLSVYNNLGILYHELHMLREAVQCLEKAHELDPEEPATMINLGLTYIDMGNHPEAREMFDAAKEIYARQYGTDHPDYANALIQGVSYSASFGDFTDEMLQEIREVERICLNSGIDSTGRLFIDCLRSYLTYYFGIKDYHKAISYGERIAGLVKQGYGPHSRLYAESRIELADCYVMLGDRKNLLRLYNEAIEIASFLDDATRESLLYDIESSRYLNYYYLEEYEISRKSMEWVIERDKARFLSLQNILSVRERANFSSELVHLVEYNDFLMHFPGDPGVISNALDNRLFIKGILTKSESSQRKALSKTGDPVLMSMHEEYLSAKIALSNMRSEFGIGKEVLDSMETGIQELEREISRRLGEEMAMEDRAIRWQDIRESLDEDEAAVEVVMFYHRTAPPVVTMHPWYLAFVITLETEENPICLKLFDAMEVIPDYEAYRAAMGSGPANGSPGPGSLGPGLYEHLWAKIDSALDGKKTIYFSPDGLFHQLNVEALADREDHYMIDKYEIRVVNTLADLMLPAPDYGDNRRALLAGDPRFRMSRTSVPDPVPIENSRSVSEFQSRMFPGTYLSQLPGTRTEVDSIGSMLESLGWECTTLTGTEATEDAVVSVKNPRILHLATHGFFARNANPPDEAGKGDLTRSYNALDMESSSKSCLFFSGAQNTLFYAYDYQEGSSDGILTAWEIAEMELDSTELVVLSACETGLGDVLNAEGVNGLMRAFRLAGARRVMISLWEVDDQATQLLMREFYSNWLSGMELDRALVRAKRYLIRETEFSHPRYWAGFILSGI